MLVETSGNTIANPDGAASADASAQKSFSDFLATEAQGTFGYTISVATRDDPLHFPKGTKFENVVETSSWIGFSVRGIFYRTDQIKKDRDGLVKWYQSSNKKLFSNKKGEETIFGAPGVTFIKV